jgi:hypothetical protein
MASHNGPLSLKGDWIMDLGATTHMSPHRAHFDTFEAIPSRKVFMGDDSVLQAVGKGSILVDTLVEGCTKRIQFKNVLYVPKLQSNLLSVSKIVEGGLQVQFGGLGCLVKAPNGVIQALATRESNLYCLRCQTVLGGESAQVATSSQDGLILWHRRMRHVNVQSLRAFPSLVSGLDFSNLHGDGLSKACEGCIEGKQQ